ncbi:MAG: glycosyltransferase family 39 protein [Nitrospinales bacterium]
MTRRIPSFIIVTLLMALGIGLRFHGLDRALGGGDENEFLLSWGYSPMELILTRYNAGGDHVFHAILVRLMILAFGEENEIAIRFPVFVFGVAGLWLVYLLARRLFHSQETAWLALLLAAVSSIHIHYSQTARGYSLIMFFSAAMTYAVIRLLESGPSWRWGGALVVCGFLSVYTIPTNVYFAVALAGWVLMALLTPSLARGFDIAPTSRNRSLAAFAAAFLVMGALSLLAHWPFLQDMAVAAKEYYLPRVEGSVWKLSGRVFQEIFPGALQWFLPFLLVGVAWGKTARPAYRLLPLVVFLIPFGVNLASGLTGFARNYLFNWPLFMVFLAAGLVRTGQYLADRANIPGNRTVAVTGGLAALYVLATVKIALFDRLPDHPLMNGHAYKRLVEKYSDPLDLIVIADSKKFLYARSVYLKNLKNIFRLNKLSGIKIIAADDAEIAAYKVNNGFREFPVFQNLVVPQTLQGKTVAPGLKIFPLAGPGSRALLPEDFETAAAWKIVAGRGKIRFDNIHKLAGKHAIILETSRQGQMVAQAPIPGNLRFKRNTLAVLLAAGYNLTAEENKPENVLAAPFIGVQDLKSKQFQYLRAGQANYGIRSKFPETTNATGTRNWTLFAYMGYFPPGRYALSLHLGGVKGQSIAYDGLRLFLVELSDPQK